MGFMLDCVSTVELFTILWVYHACCIVQHGACAFLELVSKQRDSCPLRKVVCDQSSWTYSHVMLWVHKNRVHGPLFIVWVLSWVIFLLWLVWHVSALPKVIQGPCLLCKYDTYMNTWYNYHVKDAFSSLLCWFWNHHLVTHGILLIKFLWPQIHV